MSESEFIKRMAATKHFLVNPVAIRIKFTEYVISNKMKALGQQ
jgi:hypothetical protein